jgi:catechol 2,3-dioxygenase
MKIPNETKIQSVDLRIKNLDESLNFYSNLIGLKVIEQKDNTAYLSANGAYPYLIALHEDKSAIYRPQGTTGLFHTAIRFPNRMELAKVFMRLFEHKIKFQGFSDHLVSEAIYLADPDENGVELYADRPREEWQWNMGQIEMATLPLNLNVLTDELNKEKWNTSKWNGAHSETDIGHIHLNVSNLNKAQEVYSLLLGFNVTTSSYPGALFLSAGANHHHIGTNVWSSRNGKPMPDNSVGITQFTIHLPNAEYIKFIQQNAEESSMLAEPFDGTSLSLLDFDKIKIKVTL